MKSTMQERQLLVSSIFEHGARVYSASVAISMTSDGRRETKYGEIASRVRRLANGLKRLGVRDGDRIATLAWNTQEHFEAYFAIPSLGAILHTLNLRLFAEQLAYI